MSFYDNNNMDIKTMAERCREYYNPEDFVVIMNPDIEPFTYVIQRPENVNITQPSAMTKELYYLKDPDLVMLNPGQTRMVPAYEADHVIKQLVDKMVFRNREKIATETGQTPNESTNDPATQHKYVKQIYQGKKDFMEEFNRQTVTAKKLDTDLEKELTNGLTGNTAPTVADRSKTKVA